jgi:hypothetical protein
VPTEAVLSLVTPYFAYLPADAIEASASSQPSPPASTSAGARPS